MSFNLATILRESRNANPDKACLKFLGNDLTYRHIDEESTRFAHGLRAAGFGRGDVVAMSLPNLPQFVIAYYGTLKAGATVLPLNPLLKGPEIEYHLADAGAKVLIAFEMFAEDAVAGTSKTNTPLYITTLFGGPVPEGTGPHAGLFEDLLKDPVPGDPGDPNAAYAPDGVRGDIEPTNADDIAVLLYTSGTTGRPKGAELTHFQLYMNGDVAGNLFGLREDDIALGALPFFHVFGQSSVLNLAIRFGGTISVVPRFDAKAVLDQIAADRVTVISGVPTMFQALIAEGPGDRDLSALRIGNSGGAPMPGETLRAFEAMYGIVILEGYGLSESASAATMNRSAEDRRIMSAGKPIWGVELRIADAEDKPLPPGEENIGEVLLRGHDIIPRYHNRPQETEEAFRNGWFHTGDLGYVDKDGYLFIVDRKKDLVIRGGYNVYPREIEEILYTHPAVAEAAVIGQPDERLGEEVVAVISLKKDHTATEDDIKAFCKEQMAAYKYPRVIRIIAELPKGPTGKILKKELRP